MEAALKLGFDRVQGIDIAEAAVAYANRQLGDGSALCANFLDHTFADGSFDVVTLWATLEHVSNPGPFIEEAFRVLKPGGSIAVSVPSRSGISMRFLGPRWHMVGLEHLNYYTPKGLARAWDDSTDLRSQPCRLVPSTQFRSHLIFEEGIW